MGWEKGRKRGQSPLAGKKVMALDPRWVELVLTDNESAPENRFVAVMDRLLDSMAESANSATAQIGTRLRAFWQNEMAKTVIWTPIGGENLETRLDQPPQFQEAEEE